jgi:hypothetical protein
LIVAALLALPCGAAAQDVDTRLRAMESELEHLKKRIEVLEGGPQASVRPGPPAASPRADCERIEKLRMSMSQADVRGVMGEPAKVEATPLRTLWRYACGTAYFDAETRRFVGFEQGR